jgi:prepilin-type N-terminal cleavage/methylation domain-containing protein
MNTSKQTVNHQQCRVGWIACLSTRSPKTRSQKPKTKNGLTLIEIMIVVLLMAIAVIGAMGFRLYCVTDAKKADVQAGAARIGSMILENWKGNGGPLNYDPASSLNIFTSQFVITRVGTSDNYWVQDKANSVNASDGIHYYIMLSFSAETATLPKELNVAVSWLKNYRNVINAANPIVHTITMTAYAN